MKKSWMNGETFNKLSAEKIADLSPEEAVAYSEDLQKNLEIKEKEVADKIAKLDGDNDAHKEEISSLREEMKTIQVDLVKQLGVAIKALKEQGLELSKIKSGNGTIDKGETIKSLLEANKSAIENIKDKAVDFIVSKASQAPADIGSRNELGQWISGVEDIARRNLFMKDIFRVIPTNTEYVKKMEQDVVVRDAKNVAQCATSVHTTKLTWKRTDLQTKKIRDKVDVCIDMLEDYDFTEGEIRDLIDYGIASKVDNGLLLDDGLGANLNGVASYASTFAANLAGADYSAATGTPIQAPTVADLISIAGAQIEYLGQDAKFMPNVAIVNPKQIRLLKSAKDANNLPLNQVTMVGSAMFVEGIRLIGNPLVPENEAYVMDSTKGTIYERKGAVVNMFFENNDNAEHETATVIAYERVNLWVASNNTNAFMHIASISAAITAIKAP